MFRRYDGYGRLARCLRAALGRAARLPRAAAAPAARLLLLGPSIGGGGGCLLGDVADRELTVRLVALSTSSRVDYPSKPTKMFFK